MYHSITLLVRSIQFGFSAEYSISGMVYMSHGLLHYSNDNIWLATQLARTAEALMKGHPSEHALMGRLNGFIGSVLCYVEPWQASIVRCYEGYEAATLIGDVDNAMQCAMYYSASSLFVAPDLAERQITVGRFMRQMVCLPFCLHYLQQSTVSCFSQSSHCTSNRRSTKRFTFFTVLCKWMSYHYGSTFA